MVVQRHQVSAAPRLVRLMAGPVVLLGCAAVTLFMSLGFGGGAEAPLVLDPGPVARFGLPVAKLLVNVGSAATIGALVLCCIALTPNRTAFDRALDLAATAAGVWTVASAATGLFTFLIAYNQPFSTDGSFGSVLGMFLVTTELGQAWLASTLIAAGVTVLTFAVRNLTALAFVTLLAMGGLIPMSIQGHQGGTADHDSATAAIFVHVLFAGVWLGGLLCLIVIRGTLDRAQVVALLRRYSTIALVCFIVVAASGYLSAQIRVDRIENLLSPYGALVLAKVALLLLLGLFGAVWRRYSISRMQRSDRGWFWWIVVAELAFMGIASGVAAALARTPVPVPETIPPDPTAAELLTGSPLPPPPTLERFVTLWNFDLVWILACAFGIFFYVAGVLRLHKRGDRWPWYRSVFWVGGMLVLFYVTNGGINLYQKFLFSSHMVAHMTLGMMVPVLLVAGAPVTLALRTMTKRTDGSRGPREWIMLAVHSRPFAVLANPLVAAGTFVASLWVFYYTPLFGWATSNHLGHQWMIVHFLLVGYLFVQSLIGIDPGPARPPYPIRLLILLATMAFHAFFGLALMSGTSLLLPDWYGAMGWEGIDPLKDQQSAGGIAWSVGEIPTVTLAIVVAIMWSRSDSRESKRYDRKADRDGDAELEEYNRMLAARGARMPSRPGSPHPRKSTDKEPRE